MTQPADQRRSGRPFTADASNVVTFPEPVQAWVLALRRAVRDRFGTLLAFHAAYERSMSGIKADLPNRYVLDKKEVSRQLRDGRRHPEGPSKNLVERIEELCGLSHDQAYLALRAKAAQFAVQRSRKVGAPSRETIPGPGRHGAASSPPPAGDRLFARTVVNPQLNATVSEFAFRIRRQLEHEQGINKVLDPLPITLRWSPPEDLGLVDHPANMDEHFRVVDDLTTIEAIADRFLAAQSGRLIFLGHGGAGKSTLVAEFALAVLKRRQEGDPVPVVFNLASWRPDTVMETWLAEQLIRAYPYLKNKTKRVDGKKTLASQLVEGNCLLPILDGFDEIPLPVRAQVIPTLNASLGRHAKVVLTSRPEEYRATVTSDGGDVLTGAQVVVLDPLRPERLVDYLPRSTKPLAGRDHQLTTKWDPVTSFLLHDDPPEDPHRRMLQDVFATPLMVMLVRATYSDSDADPAILLDRMRFPNADAVRRHLLDAFVPARFTYLPHPDSRGKRWEPADAQRWLGFLAALTSAQDKNKAEFAWWTAGSRLVGRSLFGATLLLFVPALAFIALAMFVVHDPWPFIIPAALFAAASIVVMGAASGLNAEPMELNWKTVERWLKTFHTDGTQSHYLWVSFRMENRFYLMFMIGGIFAPLSAVKSSIVLVPAMLGLFVLSPVVLMATQYGPTDVVSPPGLLRRDRHAALARVVLYGVVAVGLSVLALIFDSNVNQFGWLYALPVVSGLMLLASASGAWLSCCVLLSSRNMLPLRLMSFLEDAHRRGVLRQAGGVYQFRHALLQERLAMQFQKAGGRLPGDAEMARGIVDTATESPSGTKG